MTNTLQTTGESMVVSVSSYSYGIFLEKLTHLNKKLVKWGLPEASVLGREYRQEAGDDGEVVSRWYMTVQIPVATMRITGHTLIGTIEDLGKGQRLLSPIAGNLEALPVCPVEREDTGVYASAEDARISHEWFYSTYLPALEALKASNAVKLETLRTAPPVCAHCGTTRRRKSVLVFEKADGSLVQIGKDCAKEYFGVDLQMVLQGTWALMERSAGAPRDRSVDQFRADMAAAYYLITHYGYVSARVEESYVEKAQFVPQNVPLHVRRSTRTLMEDLRKFLQGPHPQINLSAEDIALAAGEDEEAAANRIASLTGEFVQAQRGTDDSAKSLSALQGFREAVQAFMEIRDGGMRTVEHYAYVIYHDMITHPEVYAQALESIMTFWADVTPEPTDEFLKNVQAVALAEANKSAGMTSMVVLKWLQATMDVPMGDFFRPAHTRMFPAAPTAGYLAPVGEKVTVALTVTERRSGTTLDGAPWHLVKGRTSENLEVVLFCKDTIYNAAEEGQELKITAKVKAHDTFKGHCSTALFYAKVIK